MTTAEYKKEHLEKIACSIRQLLIVVTHHGIHASRSSKSAVTHIVHQNQDVTSKLFFFLTSFYSCFLDELLLTVFFLY